MRLQSFRVGPYKNVLDTGEVRVEPTVTVLVGKNESGKTNLLRALEAVAPARGTRSIARHDYPRWRQKRDERSGEFEAATPVEVTFAFEDDDQVAFDDAFGPGVVKAESVVVSRRYDRDGRTWSAIEHDAQQALAHAVGTDLAVALAPSLADLRSRLATDVAAVDPNGEPTPLAVASKHALERLKSRFGEHETVADAIRSLAASRMPRFFYFDEHAMLPGTTDIEPIVVALRDGTANGLDDEQRTALALLQMGYADDELVADDYVARKAELQAVAGDLTDRVLDYWRQNPYLRLIVDVNMIEEAVPEGQRIVRRELRLNVEDTRTRFEDSLDDRSSGFRWFLSFVAAFDEFESDQGVIVLLDEPGLGLHARAQADFLRFIEERVADRHQVVFTTHSPFMVDPAHLERVRVVEYSDPDVGATVGEAGGVSNDPDTLFPLQAALGYDIAQNLFVGPDNLVVEGLSDFTYLTVLSDHLVGLGRIGLDERWRVLPAGGATNIPTFVSLVGPSLDVTVLVDGREASSQKVRNLIESGLLDNKRLVTPDLVTGRKSTDIEDVFEEADYLDLYNAANNASVSLADLVGEDAIVSRIERSTGDSDHNCPARHLLHHREDVLPQLSAKTLDRFEGLFKLINRTRARSRR